MNQQRIEIYLKKNTSTIQRPYYESEKIHRRINRKDRHKQQFDEDGKVIDSSDDGFQQPSDEDAQGNVLTMEELALTKTNNSHHTPNKQDANQQPIQKIKKLFPLQNQTEEDYESKNTKLKQ
jgi:hypothetical protein